MNIRQADYVSYGTPCGKSAKTSRRTWRFGDATKGEDIVIHESIFLCKRCAETWDDMESEAEAEARCS